MPLLARATTRCDLLVQPNQHYISPTMVASSVISEPIEPNKMTHRDALLSKAKSAICSRSALLPQSTSRSPCAISPRTPRGTHSRVVAIALPFLPLFVRRNTPSNETRYLPSHLQASCPRVRQLSVLLQKIMQQLRDPSQLS